MSNRLSSTAGNRSNILSFRNLMAVALAIGMGFALASGAFSQTDWPKKHFNLPNTGYNSNSNDSPGLGWKPAWTYPWVRTGEQTGGFVVDNNDPAGSNYFSTAGAWTVFPSPPLNASPNPYQEGYVQARVRTPDNGVAAASATWDFDILGASSGRYLVQVWFPSSAADEDQPDNAARNRNNSTHVTYTLTTQTGTETFTISQATGGGQWVQLGAGGYELDSNGSLQVSNFSDAEQVVTPPGDPDPKSEYIDDGRYVLADAIRLIPDIGSIYSSPVVFAQGGLPHGATRAVVFGYVDRDPGNREVSIDSDEITYGRVVAVDADAGPLRPSNASYISEGIDGALWSYPSSRPSERSPLEGPMGGVFSSPLYASGRIYIGSDDGQIYALDASSGNLIWNGPGQTLDNLSAGVTVNGFIPQNPSGADYFGNNYLTSDASADNVTYTFSGLTSNYYYQVYAWIPAEGAQTWAPDARYEIQAGSTTINTTVDQHAGGGSGPRWVRVGTPIFVSGNLTVQVQGGSGASGRDVVADAIRVVPDTIGAFGYCGIVADSLSSPSRVFSGNASGRLISLDTATGATNWIYPVPRRTQSSLDAASIGGMTMTPAYESGTLYYGTVTGKLGRLDNVNGSNPTLIFDKLEVGGSVVTINSITSSPMIDGANVYFATSGGYIYQVNKNSGNADLEATVNWTYPTDFTDTSTGQPPVAGAFRYSSPALINAGAANTKYIVIGSADGYLHQLPAGGPTAVTATTPVRKIQAPGAIYSSPATAEAYTSEPEPVFVGTQTGAVMGFNADPVNTTDDWGWNTLALEIFSSPAFSGRRLFVGGSDGRMYAFNKDGIGLGTWPVGDPDIADEPPGGEFDAGATGGSEEFDLEIVSKQDYEDPEAYLDISNVLADSGSATRQPTGTKPFPSDRIEWGENIYIIAWSTKHNNARVSFQLQNTGQGEQAGTLMSASQTLNQTAVADGKTVYYGKFAWVLDPNKLLTPGTSYEVQGTLRAQGTGSGGSQSANTTLTAKVPDSKSLRSGDAARQNAIPDQYTINHPFAISFPSIGQPGDGWSGVPGQPFTPSATDAGANYNGSNPIRLISPPAAARHGGNSIPIRVAVADRSMLGPNRPGNPQGLITSLRASRTDLGFNGNPINPMPWELIPNALTAPSPDYPGIAQNRVGLTKELTGGDPTRGNQNLLPASRPTGSSPGTYNRRTTVDPLRVVIDVPKYQPPSGLDGGGSPRPYTGGMRVWIDSNDQGTRGGSLDLADQRVVGRPLAGSEVYREWNFEMHVMPDFNLYAEERVLDVGKKPTGFGLSDPDFFTPYPGFTFPGGIQSSSLFERTFTLRNGGNVNLPNLRIDKRQPLISDQVFAYDFNADGRLDPSEGFGISGLAVISSLDQPFDPIPQAYVLNAPGFTGGHVLSKQRVNGIGDTTFTIPDFRQQRTEPGLWPGLPNIPLTKPLLSVKVPIGTPSGTYSNQVVAFSDRNNNGIWEPQNLEVGANPAFTVSVAVREARMTDGFTTGSMPNVDNPADPSVFGDAQPTAYRQWSGSNGVANSTGGISMLWTSNRATSNITDPANAPWYLYNSLLKFDTNANAWAPAVSGPNGQWWSATAPNQAVPAAYGANLDSLFPSGSGTGLTGTIISGSEKFSAPSISQDAANGNTWAAFTGQVDKNTPSGRMTEYRIFYGEMDNSGALTNVNPIPGVDFTTPKFSPRLSLMSGAMYAFWHASMGGRYKIFYTLNDGGGTVGSWSEREQELVIPASVTTAAEPVAIMRPQIQTFDLSGGGSRIDQVDVIYSAITRASNNADILLSRYTQQGTRLSSPAKLPKIYGEELERDTQTISSYRSKHLGWVRPRTGGTGPTSPTATTELPIIQVRRWDSANNTFLTTLDWINDPDTVITVENETGMVIYDNSNHPDTNIKNLYPRFVVDMSAGVVKFQKPISPKDKIIADYTPQTWRLTTGLQPDSAPFALLERTYRKTDGSPRDDSILPLNYTGAYKNDRLWLFSRQGAGAVRANTIYYKTYRLGLKLAKPVSLQPSGEPTSLTINVGSSGAYNGPFEFDWATNTLYFQEDMENAPVWVDYRSSDGNTYTEPQGFTSGPYKALTWIPEAKETTLLVDSMVNEGQVYAFPDPDGMRNPADPRYIPTKIWVFWSSTRANSSDIYYQTISPAIKPSTRLR